MMAGTPGVARTALALAAAAALCAAAPGETSAQGTSLTIYRDGRVLVRRWLSVAVPRGASVQAVDLGVRDADPSSFVSLDEGVEVRGARISAATGVQGSLRRALGGEVEFRVGPDTAPRYVRGTLLSLDPPTVLVDGRIRYELPGQPVFPESLVQLAPLVELDVTAGRPAAGFRLMYLTGGLSWEASYGLLLPRGGRGEAAFWGTATIRNDGAISIPGAEVQLLAGDVRAVRRPRRAAAPMVAQMSAGEPADQAVSEESVGETHIYALPGAVDLVPGTTRTVALFPRSEAQVEPEYVLRSSSPWVMRPMADTLRDLHPEVGYRVRRPATSAFGRTALPQGTVRVLESDSAGRPQLVGEAPIGHTAAGEDLRLATGTAFDVTLTRVQTAFESGGPRQSTSAHRVELHNAKREPVTVLVQDQFAGEYQLLSSSQPPDQRTGRLVGFRVSVPAGGRAVLEYRVRVRW